MGKGRKIGNAYRQSTSPANSGRLEPLQPPRAHWKEGYATLPFRPFYASWLLSIKDFVWLQPGSQSPTSPIAKALRCCVMIWNNFPDGWRTANPRADLPRPHHTHMPASMTIRIGSGSKLPSGPAEPPNKEKSMLSLAGNSLSAVLPWIQQFYSASLYMLNVSGDQRHSVVQCGCGD